MTIRLREILKERGITVVQFAEQSGISQSNISNYMSGKISPTLDTLTKIADALGIDITELFKKEKEKEENIVLVAKYEGKEVTISNQELLEFIKNKLD